MAEPAELEVVEGEGVEVSTTAIELAPPATLYGTHEPSLIAHRAKEQAEVLAAVIRSQKLSKRLGGTKEHVYIEGWTFLGSMLGVFPVTVWTRRLDEGRGWEARVEARTLQGQIVGAAEAMCSAEEPNWKGKPDYALRSMAQTRATSKAMRMPLSFVMVLAGFEATPAEEIEGFGPPPSGDERKATAAQKRKLGALAAALGWSDDERHERAGVASFNDLSMRQAAELIEAWKKLEPQGVGDSAVSGSAAKSSPGEPSLEDEGKATSAVKEETTPEEPERSAAPLSAGEEEEPPERGRQEEPTDSPADPTLDEPASDAQWEIANRHGLTATKALKRARQLWPESAPRSASALTKGQLAQLIEGALP